MCATREDRVGRPSIAENVGRRSVMIAAASTMMAMALPVRAELGIGVAGVSASTLETNNSIDLFNFHTHDHFDGVYRTAIGPLPDAMQEISHLLRDHHVDAMIPIDVRLIDILSLFARRLEGVGHGSTALTIFSGYRTPQTNAILASLSSRVAINSFHMQGRAVDLRVDGFELRRLYEMAVALRAGGVGYYEGSHIHLDSGPFRTWEYGGGGAGHDGAGAGKPRGGSSTARAALGGSTVGVSCHSRCARGRRCFKARNRPRCSVAGRSPPSLAK